MNYPLIAEKGHHPRRRSEPDRAGDRVRLLLRARGLRLREEGYETIMINCNPETVSTDYDTTDKLYFEPLTVEDVLNICEHEKPEGIIVSFGGQTPLKIAKGLEAHGVKILGTSTEGIDLAEDRQRFGALLRKHSIVHPKYGTAIFRSRSCAGAEEIGFPVLVRPSYVLGGRAMEICYNSTSLKEYMQKAVSFPRTSHSNRQFFGGCIRVRRRCGVRRKGRRDRRSDGTHRRGRNPSGDSACVIPPYHDSARKRSRRNHRITKVKPAKALKVVGLLNIQFAMKDNVSMFWR